MFKIDTIFSLASGHAVSGVAVIRISGPKALNVLKELSPSLITKNYLPRKMYFTVLKCPKSQEILDEAMVVFFPAPHSFTGENVVEIHAHGSEAVVTGILDSLSLFAGLRPAEAGEFSRRAMLNNKMSLLQVEALGNLLKAQTQQQRKLAMDQYQGAQDHFFSKIREQLLKVTANAEAMIDFVDQDLPDGFEEKIKAQISELLTLLKAQESNAGEWITNGLKVVILGEPNVGKSTLMNTLANEDVAIVSPLAGTTRDAIGRSLNFDGYKIHLTDTAGLRNQTLDSIEQQGIKIAIKKAEEANFIIYMLAADQPINLELLKGKPGLILLNKVDRLSQEKIEALRQHLHTKYPIALFMGSLTTQEEKINVFKQIKSAIVNHIKNNSQESAVVTNSRQRHCLKNITDELQQALLAPSIDIYAEHLRLACHHIGRLTGRVDVEDFLEIIFQDFCIGK